jgi:eukaryotic-like serine/threonine-protein kinase
LTDDDDVFDSVLRGVAEAPPLSRPSTFHGTERFVLGRRLGMGTFGIVHEATDRRTDRRVALKALRRPTANWLYRFKREFRALADISHPNLIRFYELVSEGDQWFFTMEVVDGVSFLRHVRGAENDCNIHILEPALVQLTLGVSALHQGGKLHCDIKPSNVLVSRSGRVVLLDFGLVDESGAGDLERHVDDRVAGTPSYMSPEQAAGASLAPASDWYSVGVMLYEALTGRLPHAGSAQDVLLAKQSVDPPSPKALLESVPDALSTLCMDLLQRNPSLRPSARSILQRLGSVDGSTGISRAGSMPFIGRGAQLQELADAFEAVREKRPVSVYLHGASGIGKTAIVERFIDGLRLDPRVVILAGRCYERESVPYKALDGLVDALSRHLIELGSDVGDVLPSDVQALARLFPVLNTVAAIRRTHSPQVGPVDQRLLRRQGFRAFKELLWRIASRVPLVLWIDDLQWGDLDGAVLLGDVLSAPDPPPLLLIASYRREDEKTSLCLGALLETRNENAAAREILVDPLTDAEVRELALALIDEKGGARAQAVVREAEGSPFLAVELARHQGGEGPTTLEKLVLRRKALLSPAAQGLLELIAVAGQPVAEQVALAAADFRTDDDGWIAELRAGHLVRAVGTEEERTLESYHDRIRETVVRNLDAERLRACHVGLARALEARGGADPEALALHFEGADDRTRAASYASMAAAAAASALAFDQAARLYRWALELHPLGDPARRDLEIQLADALATAGRYPESAKVLLRAAEGAPAELALELRRRAVEQLLQSGCIEDGLATARLVLDPLGLDAPPTRRRAVASLLYHQLRVQVRGYRYRERTPSQVSARDLARIDACRSLALGLGMVDPLLTADYASRFVLFALRAGEPGRIAEALCLEAELLGTSGFLRRVPPLLDIAQRVGDRFQDARVLGMLKQARANLAFYSGDLPRALDLCVEAAVPMREGLGAYGQGLNQLFTLLSLWWSGAVREACRQLPEVIEEARQRGNLLFSCTLRAWGAIMPLFDDDPSRGLRELDATMAEWTSPGFHLQHLCELQARVQIMLYAGEGAAAHAWLTSRWPSLERSFILGTGVTRLCAHDLRARAALGAAAGKNHRPLLAAAARDARQIERYGTSWASLALPIRAAVAFARGDATGTRRLLADAVSAFDAARMTMHAEASRRRLGQLLGGPEGKRLIARADHWMADQGVRSPTRMTAMVVPGLPDS